MMLTDGVAEDRDHVETSANRLPEAKTPASAGSCDRGVFQPLVAPGDNDQPMTG
jgi:hypothetical protein